MFIVLLFFVILLAYAMLCIYIDKRLGITNHRSYNPVLCGTFPLLFLIPLLFITKEKEFTLILGAFILELFSIIFVAIYVYHKYKLAYPYKPVKFTYYFVLPPILVIIYFMFYLIIT